ncbi:MAG TPA: branched-chain amino acid ABC transporter substrate-binding protein, partial [Candidatus Ozemobacteraceae bacterium]|nr:branched-chain amino acid ABC transporter substrate-binding protein [Candidatus Ozemobacteraceae bacterium]
RYGRDPDSFAAHAYDTVRLLESAWRQAHGSRDSLREALARTRLFRGATGSMGFDETGNDTRLVRLAVCRNGSLVRIDE